MKKIIKNNFKGIVLFTMFIAVILLSFQGNAYSAELLLDPGFESSAPNGTFPSSGKWSSAWYPTGAGAICTTTAAHSGSCGLWAYTQGLTSGLTWSGIYQEFAAFPGQTATGSAWIRTPFGQPWGTGSKACVRIEFLNSAGGIITYQDSSGVTISNSGWGNYIITTNSAPAGTVKVRYRCYLEKPNNGVTVQSIANFDDCSLTLSGQTQQPALYLSPAVIGFKKTETSKTFKIKNTGTGTLNWSALETKSWITNITPSSGSLASGSETTVTVTVLRSGLTEGNYKGLIRLTSNGGNQDLTVYMDMPIYTVPSQPSISYRDGYRLMLRKRLPNNVLDTARPYIIKGTAWSPVGIGSEGDITTRRNEFGNWYVADIQLMKEAGINTVYTFIDMWTDLRGIEVLDNLYKNGIMAIVTVDEDGSDNTIIITQVVNAYKNHPAILMWALGNEWNLWRPDRPLYYGHYSTLAAAANAMQANALQVKSLDANHVVASILGEINYPTQSDVNNIVNNICTAVDVWGANIYRGPEFYALFTEWNGISTKPLFLSEFGTDAFRNTVGQEDEVMQADFDHSLWLDLVQELSADDPSKVCLGGSVFEWNDEWWKVKAINGGSPSVHDNGGYYTDWNPIAHPDSFANEEWFGIVDINRKVRQSYNTFKEDFNNPMLDPIGKKIVYEGLPLQFVVTAFDPNSDPLTLTASGLPSGAVFNASTGNFSWTPNYTQAGTYFIHFEATDGVLNDSEDVEVKVENVLVFGTIYTKPGTVLVPLKDAIISVKNLARTTTYASAITDANGKFYVVATLPDNNYIIEISKASYELLWGMTILRNNQTLPLAMTLYPPAFAGMPDMVYVDENAPLVMTISATDQNNDKLSFSATNLPEGATLTDNNNNTANLSWTPDSGQQGNYNVSLEVTDGLLPTIATLAIEVKNVNIPPVMEPIADSVIYEGRVLALNLKAADSDVGDVLTFFSDILPNGAAFNGATGEFIWTPDFNQAGVYSITFKVEDGKGGEDVKIARITVINSSLYGKVLNEKTKAPIAGADIKILQGLKVIASCITNQDGGYVVAANLRGGRYIISISAQSYSSKIDMIKILENSSLNKNFLLNPRHKFVFPKLGQRR
ncbi:MAG: putative Ig domain-containing protein [Candidatus Omnitrophota bacterium]|nr:putative Ig domain-containing protein [Candidatus Omnitrophota bacterium]